MTAKKKSTKKISEVLSSGIKTVAEGVTIEKLSAQFFDLKQLKNQPEPIYRLDSSGHRYYYRLENDEPIFYTSVTTMIKNTLPTSPHLIKWLIDKGGDEGRNEAEERAHYGTLLHICCGELLITGKFDLDKLSDKTADYVLTNNVTQAKSWIEELKKDVLCFAQFIIDRNVKPLAIELILWHPTDGYAGAIDIVCSMDWQKGRINAIVDIKSGKKGFYESHEIQLRAYKEMFGIHFPDIPIDKTFNWSPKDFRGTTPTYNLKDQTESKNIDKLPYLVNLAKIEDAKRINTVSIVGGKIDLLKGLDGNINEFTFTELIKRNK